MKNLLALTLCLFISLNSGFAQMGDIYMEKYLELQKDFDSRDIDAFSSHFTDQINFVSPMGTECTEKQCVYDSHSPLFKMWGPAPADLKNNVTVIQSFSLGENYHLLSLKNQQTTGGESQAYMYTLIFEQNGSDLKVKSVQLTPVVEMK